MSKPTYTPWSRGVTEHVKPGMTLTRSEFLDFELVLARFSDTTHERGDASLRARLHFALYGDEDE